MFYEVLMEKRAEREEGEKRDSSLDQQRHKNLRGGKTLNPALILGRRVAEGVTLRKRD